MNDNLEQQYGHLWGALDQGWVLLKAPDLPGGFCVFNKQNNTVLCIESDDVNMAVCKRMKDAGREVLENIPKPGVAVIPSIPA